MNFAFTFVLAGGKGDRLRPLTNSRAKPLLPFLGTKRIIDFTLLNCLRSEIFQAWVLTCNDAVPLDVSTPESWADGQGRLLDRMDGGKWVRSLGEARYAGTADSVRQNLFRISQKTREVLILAGDHVYEMDYRGLLDFHRRKKARVTVSAWETDWSEAGRFGILKTDSQGRIVDFQEKPKNIRSLRDASPMALASMGIYVFDADFLLNMLPRFAGNDFGGDFLPSLVNSNMLYAYNTTMEDGICRYWHDVGTIDSYWETQMAGLQKEWGASFDRSFTNSVFVHGTPRNPSCSTNRNPHSFAPVVLGRVVSSALCRGVVVHAGAEVYESILLEGATIGPEARIRRTVVNRNAVVPARTMIGFDRDADKRAYKVSTGGVVVVSGQLVHCPVVVKDKGSQIALGH